MTQTQSRKKNLFQMNVDLMHGPIFRSLVLFMLPILISNLFQQLYNTVDTMIVGNVLGDTALAAIGSCGAIYELLVGAVLGIVNGLRIYLMYTFLFPGQYQNVMGYAIVVSVSLFFSVILAKLVGGMLPLAAKKLGADPAIMATPFITTIVDACSLILYFQIAQLVFRNMM